MHLFLEKKIHLVLSEDEAKWLKYAMISPLDKKTEQEEENIDKAMRNSFFTLLKGVV